MEVTRKLSTIYDAIKMIKAFINRRKIPNVIMVIGKVRMTNIGFTINLKRAITIATAIAET